jgi:oligosaccharide repeat unit polymerase
MIALLCVILVIPFFIFRPKDFFQPELFLNLYFIILIGLGPLALYGFRPEIFEQGNYNTVLLIIILGFVSINVGFLSYNLIHKKFKIVRSTSLTQSSEYFREWAFKKRKPLRLISIILTASAIIAGAIYYLRAGQIPLLAVNKEEARVAALAISGNGYFLYILTLGIISPALMALGYISKTRKLRLFSPILILATAAAFTLLLFTGSRRYSVWLCIYILAVHHYMGKQISIKKFLLFTIAGLLFINIFEMVRNPDSETTVDFLTTASYRLIIYISNLEKVFTAFIHHEKFYGSTLLMDLSTVLPGKQVDYQSWLKDIVGLEFEGFGIPPTIMGDLYINFGYPGIIIGCVAFGYLIKTIYQSQIIKGKSAIGLLIYISSLEISSKIITSGLSAQTISMVWMTTIYLLIITSIKLTSKTRVHNEN